MAECLGCPACIVLLPAVASTSIEDCYCVAHYYNNATSGPVVCAPCFVGTACEDDHEGLSVGSLPIHVGYYRCAIRAPFDAMNRLATAVDARLCPSRIDHRPSNTSLDVRRCHDAGENCRGKSECHESSSGCRGTIANSSTDLCEPSLTGVYCRLCREENHYYERASESSKATCTESENTLLVTIVRARGPRAVW